MIIHVDSKTADCGYDICISRGAIDNISQYIKSDRKTLIVTDSGVPKKYLEKLLSGIDKATFLTIPQGETSKSPENYFLILKTLKDANFTRSDRIIALGGGVIGDLSGFAAATYMRGIQFINIPTTLLSMVDSSIGGKTAIDLDGVKNIVGAFYQPHAVIVDTNTLDTLDNRQLMAGYAEAIKMAACRDGELFSAIEHIGRDDIRSNIDMIVEGSLKIKGAVVKDDPTEKGLRRVLNFGHTVGHAIESVYHGELLHGECVALGMLAMCSGEAKERIYSLLGSLGYKTKVDASKEELLKYLLLDKKKSADSITTVWVEKIGNFIFKSENADEILSHTDMILTPRCEDREK